MSIEHIKIDGMCYKTRNGITVCDLQIDQRTGMLYATLDGEYKIHWTPTGYYDVRVFSPYDLVEAIPKENVKVA